MTATAMPTITACKHCANTTRSSRDVARIQGWRFFEGTSQTGKPLTDVVCPTCSGRGEKKEESGAEWVVHCRTCDWRSDEGDPDDEPITDGKHARDIAGDHECEPDVVIRMPGDDRWRTEWDFNRDGTLRGDGGR